MYTYKIMLRPNNKQKTRIKLTINKCVEAHNIIYDILDNCLKNKTKTPSLSEIRKEFTLIKGIKDKEVLNQRLGLTNKEIREKHLDTLFYDVSNDSLKQEVKDAYKSFVTFLKKNSKYPKKKKYSNYPKSMYVDPYKIRFTNNKVKLEKLVNTKKQNRQVLNWIKLSEKDRIPLNCKYYNPRVSFDGENFWLTVGVEDAYRPKKKLNKVTNDTLGIDMNIKEIVTSNKIHYQNVNKDKKIKKEIKKLKRIQRSLSRKYEANKNIEERKNKKSKNFIKNLNSLRKRYKRINNLKDDRFTKIIEDIYLRPPKKIVIEDLDIDSMRKNKQISSYIQISSFRKFYNRLKDKAIKYKTEIITADRYYPSSKMCSCCGNIKKTLLLSERTYKCDLCGLTINRDYNASINLKNYRK